MFTNRKHDMEVILNIGLDGVPVNGESYTNGRRNPAVVERMFAAVQACRSNGFKVTKAKLVQSDTEPTLVAVVDDLNAPGQDNRIDMLSTTLKQDCIAAWYPAEQYGQLIGPRADSWGAFNPEFFIMPDGSRLASPAAQAA